jgi:ferredoxin
MTTYTVRVVTQGTEHTLIVPHGSNLRRVLLEAGFSPYATLTQRLNCGGRGLCATCGVWIEAGEPAPAHWHDRIGASFGYPRLSCQITVTSDMTLRLLDDKRIWGGPDSERRWQGG